MYPAFSPLQTKLHLAQWNGLEHPLEVFEAGDFDVWQAAQTARNFNRDFVVSLIATPSPDTWLFAGCWHVEGDPDFGPADYDTLVGRNGPDTYNYTLTPVAATADLSGRLNIRYIKTARASYRLFETLSDQLLVSSLMDAPRGTPRFRGYRSVRLKWRTLQRIIAERPDDWRTALSSVGGVYLIVTADGHQYVGSAHGEEGFWRRWSTYVETGGHGGNVGLQALMRDQADVTQSFQFSILETADTGASREHIIARESHWKHVLGSRSTGLNLN
ncbi:GIY-YIG nuclease family protein [Hasllibacter sp. MH4015]|uniref:GIY-YIG nuclease family protein n=1 Tax=Hasllibacter sp. MH4015 TaxID=2854029 RepID=UPI001CD74391|nr:GIY-YIG nuclease family protein [Hasllibacter sp. MH4015]